MSNQFAAAHARCASGLVWLADEEELFRARILAILAAHDQATPLFLNYDSKIAHYPLQAPIEYQKLMDAFVARCIARSITEANYQPVTSSKACAPLGPLRTP